MLTHPTLDQLRALKLDGMADAFVELQSQDNARDLSHGDGRFARLFRTLIKADLLILDDWGPDRLTASQRRDLMEIVEDRYGAGSTLITSQLPVEAWHEVIGEPTFADAILDRIVHNAYRLALDGPSMRDPKMSRSDTAGPVAEMADATATKSAKAVKK